MIYLSTYEPSSDSFQKAAFLSSCDPSLNKSPKKHEVELEIDFPGISTYLSQTKGLASQLDMDDIIVYIIPKNQTSEKPYCRFVAVLQVLTSWHSHQEALRWYQDRKLCQPKCCSCHEDNLPPSTTAHFSSQHFAFHICQKLYCQTKRPPLLTDFHLQKIFGPLNFSTLPAPIPQYQVDHLLKMVGQPPLQSLIDASKV